MEKAFDIATLFYFLYKFSFKKLKSLFLWLKITFISIRKKNCFFCCHFIYRYIMNIEFMLRKHKL